MSSVDSPVIIIGAGMAGLTCAVYLKQAGIAALLIDAADAVGGRVRTDVVGGFQLDRGFQILLTAYPEARRLLNYEALELQRFRSGALIRDQAPNAAAQWMTLLNPFQEPFSVFKTLASPIGTLSDKIRIFELMRRTQELPIDELFRQTPTTTLALLHEIGFSDRMIERFFRPFFGGVFLEDALITSSNFFEFCFRMFFSGDAAVPASGIGAIPAQLAGRLSPAQIRLKTTVSHIDGQTVVLDSGESLTGRAVVLAVDAAQADRLLGVPTASHSELSERLFNHTTCTYFAAPRSIDPPAIPAKKLLLLNTHRSSAIHNIALMSDVAPAYAPADQTLVSVSTQGLETVNETALTERIRLELMEWFGADARHWKHLRTYHLPQALPAYPPVVDTPTSIHQPAVHKPLKLSESLYQCGDQTTYPSLNAAMQTGREVAELIAAH
ncbi:NAD(P)/FAD-dependent oxidoreductase [Spirosoma utsteinense]|uniref:Phytoene dehydrogenase-like protein n=1 Tax=Spirosoma utsteinense TaxID=2585773 RepID=A0ABR6WAH2_9BACT|nr:NAD(P)/FAD-dependent oxidoreductase [Spirosoma utsteinense]MBC3786777.1 phytoene dehydrogenase-like protein [Spirosoma utsteinense]MBC3793279.1 phytoene dehydrogenase-like protein [Spirosoma utsteinense]